MVAYTGSCHCGTVRYKFEMSPPMEERKVVTCNCSCCSTTGRLLVHVPNTDFAYTEGTDNLSTYRWGSKSITASFCKTCGIQVASESRAKEFMFGMVGINVRTVHEIDLETLNLHKVDGKNFSLPPYVEKN